MTEAETSPTETRVGQIPVVFVRPEDHAAPIRLALWLPPFTTDRHFAVPFLTELAAAGFTALSLDPWQHGERASESPEQLSARVGSGFRRHMWPILGNTTLDAVRVLDWAVSEFGVPTRVVAGGVSMGGDIAVALAGADQRVSRVAAIVATPDWTRPGMRTLGENPQPTDQGEPDSYASWFYQRLDPITHLESYVNGPEITFECGQLDVHVPPEAALRFQAALNQAGPLRETGAPRIRVNLHPGMDHFGPSQDRGVLDSCLAWLGA
jgi:uncharacterized protein